jgi:hypothetical protein
MANGIKQAWSKRKKAMLWSFETSVDGKRFRQGGLRTRNDAEVAMAEIEVKCGSIGAIAELIVCSDLLRQGFDVFRSVSNNAACDIIAATYSGELCRIEVKSAVMRKGTIRFKRYRFDTLKHDVLALVFVKTGEIEYSVDVQEWFDLRKIGPSVENKLAKLGQ